MREFKVTPRAAKQAEILGYGPEHLVGMLRHSMPYRHPVANRRHEKVLFLVDGNTVLEVITDGVDSKEEGSDVAL